MSTPTPACPTPPTPEPSACFAVLDDQRGVLIQNRHGALVWCGAWADTARVVTPAELPFLRVDVGPLSAADRAGLEAYLWWYR